MDLERKIESLLFTSAKPLSVKDLSFYLKEKKEAVKEALDSLMLYYREQERGLRVVENGSKYQMTTAPENSALLQKFLEKELSGDLSPASLETLTIIAYRGPIKKIDLEKIRGVNCSLILRNLLIRGLVEDLSSEDEEESEYMVTVDFIKFLGIDSLKELPDYEKFNKNEAIDALLGKIEEPLESSPNNFSSNSDQQ